MRPAPLAIVVIAHPDLPEREAAVKQLFRRLYRDPDLPFAPSPAVPVVAGRIVGDGDLVSPSLRVDRTAILVILDDHAIVDKKFLAGVDRLAASTRLDHHRVFVVPMTTNAYRIASDFMRINFLRVDCAPEGLVWTRIGSSLTHELCRWLQGHARLPATPHGDAAGEVPVVVFLSHAKADGVDIATGFAEHLQKQTRLDSFFDAHDIAPGFAFGREIEHRVDKSILLVIRTDAYGAREWCQREVLVAKRSGVPIVVVDALEGTERRSFPYLGNVPTIRFRTGDPLRFERVLDFLLDETLRQLHFQRRVERLVADSHRPKPVILGSAPELVRFALTRESERRGGTRPRLRRRHVVYPDPPVSGPETDVLAHDAERIRAESLTQFVVGRNSGLLGKLVAISTSEVGAAEDLGLTALHQRDLIVELARHLFAAGARIAFGGDFRKAGFTELLVEVQRAHMRYSGPTPPGIVSYVTEPLTVEERASYVDTVEFIVVELPPEEAGVSEERRRALRYRSLRRRIIGDVMALVVIGGRTASFVGWRPGVAEEIATAVRARRPTLLVGGFGGVASEYATAALLGGGIPVATTSPSLGQEPDGTFGLPAPVEVIERLKRAALSNGLTMDENVRLAQTADTDEIVALVLRGLVRNAKVPRSK